MNFWMLILLLSGLQINFLIATDTLTHTTPNVMVKDSSLGNFSEKYFPKQTIKISQTNQVNSLDLSEILKTKGIYIREYGGLGGLKTVLVRGSSPSQTTISLDGFKLNSSQNNIADLSILPKNIVKSVSVIKTGASLLTGSGAMGGGLNLSTNAFDESSLGISYGSFGTNILNGIYSNDDFYGNKIQVFASYLNSDGDYPVSFQKNKNVVDTVRTNSDFTQINFSLAHNFSYENGSFFQRIITNGSDRGTPGALVRNGLENTTNRLNDRQIIYLSKNKHVLDSNKILTSGLYFKYLNIEWIDKKDDGLDLGVIYISQDIGFYSEYSHILERGSYRVKIYLEQSHLNPFSPETKSQNRFIPSISLSGDYEIIDDFLSIFSGIRSDYWDEEMIYSPSVNMLLNFPLNFNIKFSLSSNYRLPGFNELYYPNYGNPDLDLERSLNYALDFEFKINSFFLSISPFYTKYENLIHSVPKDNSGIMTAQNISEAESKGVEFLGQYSFDDFLRLNINYTRQYVLDRSGDEQKEGKALPYSPKDLFSSSLSLNYQNFDFEISTIYSASRYFSPGEIPRSRMEPYLLLDLMIAYNFELFDDSTKKTTLGLSLKNVMDKEYQVIRNYPMPKFNFLIFLNYNL
jgi:vitamin B12 transporter